MPRLHSFQVRTSTGALVIVIVGAIIFYALFNNINSFHSLIDQFDIRRTGIENVQE